MDEEYNQRLRLHGGEEEVPWVKRIGHSYDG